MSLRIDNFILTICYNLPEIKYHEYLILKSYLQMKK